MSDTDRLAADVEYHTPQGVIDNWRKQTKDQLIDTLQVYYEGMVELQRTPLDVERLAYALNRAFGVQVVGGPLNTIAADPMAAARTLAREYDALG